MYSKLIKIIILVLFILGNTNNQFAFAGAPLPAEDNSAVVKVGQIALI